LSDVFVLVVRAASAARYDHKTMSAGNAQEIADIADFKGEQILCMLLDSSGFTSVSIWK
jgi:hypothetical protein